MSRGPYPILLVLAMSLPGAARALGLGDIRVDSALNEPLSAQIDIVGATREELVALTAKVANREVFQRYAAERPGFLTTASFKVGLDAQGRPVLNIRSTEAFTDPLVNLLIDLKWDNGELIREYSLLLDPAGLASRRAASAATAATAAAAPDATADADTAVPTRQTSVAAETPQGSVRPGTHGAGALEGPAPRAVALAQNAKRARRSSAPRAPDDNHAKGVAGSHVRVAARDTLRSIARRLGARSEPHVQRLMVALYRSNPQAFDGNINRLHRGAVLTVPDAAALAAVDLIDARRTVRAQMTAWRLDGRSAAPDRAAAAAPSASAAVNAAAERAAAPHDATPPAETALQSRLQALEQEIQAIHQQLAQLMPPRKGPERPPAAAADVRVEVLRTEPSRDGAAKESPLAASTPEPRGRKTLFAGLAAGAGLLLVSLGYARRRLAHAGRATVLPSIPEPVDAPPVPAPKAAPPVSLAEPPRVNRSATPPMTAPPAPIVAREIVPAPLERTQDLGIDVEALEKSYLESLAIDTLGLGAAAREPSAHAAPSSATSAGDTATQPILAHQPAPADTATVEAVILDPSTAQSADSPHGTAVLERLPRPGSAAEGYAASTAAVNTTVLDYDLLDLDATAQHVHMPSQLNESAVFAERRTNIVDALKAAIERDPHRHDLRMKLLETYHNAVALNRRAFLDHVKLLAREREALSEDQWKKITSMGREIAKEEMPFDAADGNKLADCA